MERNAIIDLVQSLGSGRLYQQAQNMCHHYSNPLLLIEFDPAKGFVLQSSYAIARREIEVGTKDLLGKLSLLVLHFPKLRLMWSPSPRFTADIFMKLKDRVSGSLYPTLWFPLTMHMYMSTTNMLLKINLADGVPL